MLAHSPWGGGGLQHYFLDTIIFRLRHFDPRGQMCSLFLLLSQVLHATLIHPSCFCCFWSLRHWIMT